MYQIRVVRPNLAWLDVFEGGVLVRLWLTSSGDSPSTPRAKWFDCLLSIANKYMDLDWRRQRRRVMSGQLGAFGRQANQTLPLALSRSTQHPALGPGCERVSIKVEKVKFGLTTIWVRTPHFPRSERLCGLMELYGHYVKQYSSLAWNVGYRGNRMEIPERKCEWCR